MALISVWGEGTPHASEYEAARLLQVLKHTMLLVSAVLLACKRTTSESRSSDFLDQMSLYLSDLQIVHTDANYRPYHHLSMHLPHFFYLFGPARCFWTYPFERLIGRIQRLLSNHKLGTFLLLRFHRITSSFNGVIRSNGIDTSYLFPKGVKN